MLHLWSMRLQSKICYEPGKRWLNEGILAMFKSDICYKISAIGKCLQGKYRDGDILHTNVYDIYTLYIPFPS